MRSKLIGLLALSLAVGAGCEEQDRAAQPPSAPPSAEALVRFHFLGTRQLAKDPDAAPWMKMGALPATQTLTQQTLRKLAQAPFQLLQHRLAGTTNDYAPVFQELFGDLLPAESVVEITGDTNRFAEWELAVRLPEARAAFWKTNLQAVVEAWTGRRAEPLHTAEGDGWELKAGPTPGVVRWMRWGAWTVVGCGPERLPLQAEWLQRIMQHGHPALEHSSPIRAADPWLDAWVDAPRLPAIPGCPLPAELPALHLTLTGRAENLRTKIDFLCHEAIRWTAQPWQVPTNLVREPLISFTALQGFGPELQKHPAALGVPLDPAPDQLFLWACANNPYQSFAAVPVVDATNQARALGERWLARFSPVLQRQSAGTLRMETNAGALFWQSAPFVAPTLQPVRDAGAAFLFGSLFANTPATNPPPRELLGQILGRTNLVYYDWEITQERLRDWRNLADLYQLVFEKRRLSPKSASVLWFNAVSASLGNTITEVTVADAHRLTLVRKSPVGLTGFELLCLANWLESPGFPLNGYSLPPTGTSGETSTSARKP